MIPNDHLYKSEMLVLSLLQNKELEFYEISQRLSSFDIKQGILFTILYQLEQAQLISHTKQDYYHIEEAGLIRLDMLKRQYQTLQEDINNFIKVNEHE